MNRNFRGRGVEWSIGYRSGMPRLGNSRLTCNDVIRRMAYSGLAGTQEDWNLDVESIHDVATYCANRWCLEDKPENYCYGCTLYQPDEDGEDEEPYDIWVVAAAVLQRDLNIGRKGQGLKPDIWQQSRPRTETEQDRYNALHADNDDDFENLPVTWEKIKFEVKMFYVECMVEWELFWWRLGRKLHRMTERWKR